MSRHETTGRNVAMIGNTAKNEGRRSWRKGRHSPSSGRTDEKQIGKLLRPTLFLLPSFTTFAGDRRGLVTIKLENFLFPLASAPGPCYLCM